MPTVASAPTSCIDPLPAGLLALAKKLGSATLHEAGGKKGALPSAIKPLRSDWRIAAPVYTVVGPPQDNLWLHHGIYSAPRGFVLLHECGGDTEAGYWGGIMANAAIERGIEGFVTEGGVRDVEELRGLPLPIFSANICIRGTTKRPDGAGSIGKSALLGGILVTTGDLLVADGDGVVVISRANAEQVVAAGAERERDERAMIKRLRSGERTLDVYNMPMVDL